MQTDTPSRQHPCILNNLQRSGARVMPAVSNHWGNMKCFENSAEGIFLDRPNRFIAIVETDSGQERVHCPNPGRLHEILIPGTQVILEKGTNPNRKTAYSLAAAYYQNKVIPLNSTRANKIAQDLILPELFPDFISLEPEKTIAGSRFDFLVRNPGKDALVEVKACTLMEHGVAMFPDAPTLRGTRHITELAEIAESGGFETHVLFVLMHADSRRFIPSIHTDPLFSIRLKNVSDRLKIHAASVEAKSDGTVFLVAPEIPVEFGPVKWAEADSGCYLLIVHLQKKETITIGALGSINFPPGYYVYVGSAKKHLSKRTARHLRKRKTLRWHIDYLIQAGDSVKALPIYNGEDLECPIARELSQYRTQLIPRFGSSDCTCNSHLIYWDADPLKDPEFLSVLLKYRHTVQGFGK